MRAESPRPKHLPKTLPPSTITLGIRCQCMDLGWKMQIFSQFKKCSLVLESLPIFVCVHRCFCSELQWTQEMPASVMYCLECILLLTNCSGSDFSVWGCPVLHPPLQGANSDLLVYVCESLLSCVVVVKGGWSRNVLETVLFALIWSSKDSKILAVVQCQNLGRGAEVGLIIPKCDSNWSPSILITS